MKYPGTRVANVIAPSISNWLGDSPRTRLDQQTRREILAHRKYDEARRSGRRAAYISCARFLSGLLNASPQSTKIRQWRDICVFRASRKRSA